MNPNALPKLKRGRTVRILRFVPGFPVGLPTGAWVEVVDTAQSGARVQVRSTIGNLYWVDRDAVEPLG